MFSTSSNNNFILRAKSRSYLEKSVSSSFYLFLYFGTLFTAIAVFLLWLFYKKILEHGRISRSLNLELLLIRFPPYHPEHELNLQQIREKIALMEQLYSHLSVIRDSWFNGILYEKPFFALELTIPHIGEEITYYVAVPRRLVPAVEKIIQGVYPEAHVEKSKDYNIFNPDGASSGAILFPKANKFYPLKTYQKLEGDPLKQITNVFTKLAIEGEGAALQIVARPARKKWNRILKKRAREIHEGKGPQDFFSKSVGAVSEVFSSGKSEEEKMKQQRRITPLEEEVVKMLEAKSGKPLFETNVRLLASAKTLSRAHEILNGLKAAFEQFSDPNANSFKPANVEGKSLKNLIFNFSFRLFNPKNKIVLSSEELTSILHFPNVPMETPKIKILKSREAPPPASLPVEGLVLGYNLFRGETREIRMLDDDRRRHLYIIGQTGTGKSVFLENMTIQDIAAGKGVCMIDPHGETIAKVLGSIPRERLQDVIYFDPGDTARPMGLNMLEYDERFPEQKTFIVNELFSIFQKLYGAVPEALGPIFEQYFRNATMLVMDDPSSGNTLLEIVRVMSDKPFRDLKISRAKNVVVKNFWTQIAEKAGGEGELKNLVPYITSKFDNFIANEIMRPIIAQEKSAFNFREVMDNGKILLVNLSKGRLGDINSALIGLIVVGKLLMAALSRADSDPEKRRDFYLYIDEFQNVTTDSIATILSEARKYKLDLIITHQFIGQLKEEIKKAVFGNAGSIISFRIGSDDAEFMAKQYKPHFSEHDLLNLDNANCYVKLLIRGQTSQPFSMKTYPPQKGNPEIAAAAKEYSRLKYGRPREEIEQEIVERHQTT